METKNSDTCAKLRSLPPATKLGQGYIFTGVCDSVNRGACVVAPGGRAWFLLGGHAWFFLGGRAWFFLRRIRRDMVNERAVRILLECILVTVVNLPQFSKRCSFSVEFE